jgi:hypothetical protein
LICYFNIPGQPKQIKIKTFRCDYSTSNQGTIYVYIPEEIMTLQKLVDYEIVLTTRGVSDGKGDGLEG